MRSLSSADRCATCEDAPDAARRSSPDFVEALARGLDIIKAFSPTATALSVSDAAARDRAAAADGSAAADDARAARVRPVEPRRVHADDEGPRAGHGVHRRPGHLGAGPAAPGGARRPDRGVELDVAARRQRHRVRGPRAGAEDHRPVGAHRHAVPGGGDVDGPRAAGRPRRRGSSTRCWRRRRSRGSSRASCRPAAELDATWRSPRAGLGAVGRAAVARHPLDRRAGPRRVRDGPRPR